MGEQDNDHKPWFENTIRGLTNRGGACSKLGGVSAMFYAAGAPEWYADMAIQNLNWVTYFIDNGMDNL
jgi:hypothetical protein